MILLSGEGLAYGDSSAEHRLFCVPRLPLVVARSGESSWRGISFLMEQAGAMRWSRACCHQCCVACLGSNQDWGGLTESVARTESY
jgi:hypothetical protein